MIIPAQIPGWKRPPIELAAVIEPHERFKLDKEVSADHDLFNFAEKNNPSDGKILGMKRSGYIKTLHWDNLN